MPNQNDEIVQEFIRKKEQRDAKGLNGRKQAYYNRINSGIYKYFVPAYEYELRDKIREKIGEKRMSKREIEVSLTKGFNRVAVNYREIDDTENFDLLKQEAMTEVRDLWNSLPHSDETSKHAKQESKASYESKRNTNYQAPKPQYNSNGGKITTRFAKGKQVGLLQQGIDKGIFTLEEVNNIQSWDETQEYIQAVFRAK